MSTALTVNPAEAKVLVQDTMNAGLVPLLKGSPGTSKSSIMARIAKENNLKLVDIRLAQIDEVELNGFPDLSGEKATYKQFDIFPTVGDEIPEGYKGWLLFFDELTSADKIKQGAAYKIILDRMVGQEKLHSKAFCTAAGNLLSDRAVVNNMSTAMQSRLIHINMGTDVNDWINWALHSGIDNRVISYLQYKPTHIHKFDPNHQEDTFACQRTWEFVSKIIKQWPDSIPASKAPLLAGTISHGVSAEFMAFCRLSDELVKFKDVMKDPENAPIPVNDAGSMYSTVGMLADNVTLENIEQVWPYIARIPTEFQLALIRRIYVTLPKIAKVKVVEDWVRSNKDSFR